MRHLKAWLRRWKQWRNRKHRSRWDIHGKDLLAEFVKDRRQGEDWR